MNRDWQVGDVAALTFKDGSSAVGVRNSGNSGWAHSSDWGAGASFDSIGGASARPLVVIDPEDREQVRRALAAWFGARTSSVTADEVTRAQDAYRSLVALPKPDEPHGLGAVVRDGDGRLWIRVEPALDTSIEYAAWQNRVPHAIPSVKSWSNVNAVEVLSEGVTA